MTKDDAVMVAEALRPIIRAILEEMQGVDTSPIFEKRIAQLEESVAALKNNNQLKSALGIKPRYGLPRKS